jgi:hypothetical protein
VVDPKPLLDVPAIILLCKDVARGHMRQGANVKRARARNHLVTRDHRPRSYQEMELALTRPSLGSAF